MEDELIDDIMTLEDGVAPKERTTPFDMLVDLEEDDAFKLDCYPYSFSPLLLFAQSSYFDKGYSNYNSVAQFFQTVIPINMLDNVLFDRKNMLYEELFSYVIQHEMLVICCIDEHFTAVQVFSDNSLVLYDPRKPQLQKFKGDSFRAFLVYLLLKCSYADSNHIQENKEHYTGTLSTNVTRQCIYQTWKQINKLNGPMGRIKSEAVALPLKRYLFINDPSNMKLMSTQLTSNTCYFQVFLFAVLVKVGSMKKSTTAHVSLETPDAVEAVTRNICRFTLEFFANNHALRPLTNCNFVLDFYRYKTSAYFTVMSDYLGVDTEAPNYAAQYERVLDYFQSRRCLHAYERFAVQGAMSSAPNTKSLQAVTGHDDAVQKLAKCANYYKYRPANFMFGWNSNVMMGLQSFCEYNALRKNQLLQFYQTLQESFPGCADAVASLTKYRDYCE
jgi:hypothetical protein